VFDLEKEVKPWLRFQISFTTPGCSQYDASRAVSFDVTEVRPLLDMGG